MVKIAKGEEKKSIKGILLTRMGIIIGIIFSVILGYYLPLNIIGRGTALFFEVCAATFLPIYICGLFWKKTTKAGAVSGMLVGLISSLFWILFIHKAQWYRPEQVTVITGNESIFNFPWDSIDSILIALPLSFIVIVVVSLFTKPLSEEIIKKSFK